MSYDKRPELERQFMHYLGRDDLFTGSEDFVLGVAYGGDREQPKYVFKMPTKVKADSLEDAKLKYAIISGIYSDSFFDKINLTYWNCNIVTHDDFYRNYFS